MAFDRDDIYILRGASHALRSYQYGNSAPALAQEFADRLDAICERAIGEFIRAAPELRENSGMADFITSEKRAMSARCNQATLARLARLARSALALWPTTVAPT
jgi:hypothetical protein